MIRIPRWPHRHTEPLRWLLFGAGGVIAALLLPGLALGIGLLAPLGLVDLAALGPTALGLWGFVVRLGLHGVVALLVFHAGHRVYHGLHDLRLPRGRLAWALTYGLGWAWVAIAALDLLGVIGHLIRLVG